MTYKDGCMKIENLVIEGEPNLDYWEEVFEKEGYDYLKNLSGKYIGYGLMKQEKQTLVLTNQGKMISDNIISELMLPADR